MDPRDSLVRVPVYLRERKTASPTSPPPNLFGQPLLVSLPQSCSVLELYNSLLERMARYVSQPQPGEEWWRPEETVSMETEAGTGNDDEDMLSEEEEVVGPVKLFTLHLVNSYGNAQLEPIDSNAGRIGHSNLITMYIW